MKLANFKWDQDQDGIVTLVWDTPDKQVNVLSMAAIAELTQVAETITKDPAIKGLVLTSGKPGAFSAGADLDEMSAYAGQGGGDARELTRLIGNLHPDGHLIITVGCGVGHCTIPFLSRYRLSVLVHCTVGEPED